MAGELNLGIQFGYAKNGVTISKTPTLALTVTGNLSTAAVQTITTTAAQVDLGAVTAPGYCVFHNVDTTNTIYIDDATIPAAVSALRLKPGEWAVVRWNNTAIWAKSSATTADLEYALLPD